MSIQYAVMEKPNILYLHCHDAGRIVEPLYDGAITPNLKELAERGMTFSNAHAACPTCSPSRASLLTGRSPHCSGMMGLAHLGYRFHSYKKHLVQRLRELDYSTVLAGIQHEAPLSEMIGYDRILVDRPNPDEICESVEEYFASRARTSQPFFLSVGIHQPHREKSTFPEGTERPMKEENTAPLRGLLDGPETRADTANYLNSITFMDFSVGRVLNSLQQSGLGENTLIVCTTDHGPPFPGMKCNLKDSGTGVYLFFSGPGVSKGKLNNELVSHLDCFATIMEAAGGAPESDCEGFSLWPLLAEEKHSIRECVFGEVNDHVDFEPMRSIRTKEFCFIMRLSKSLRPSLANCDAGLSRKFYKREGFFDRDHSRFELYDLDNDPLETDNLAENPEYGSICREFEERIVEHMRTTNDLVGYNLYGQNIRPINLKIAR